MALEVIRKRMTTIFPCRRCGAKNEANPAQIMGRITSARKAAASRNNGKLGGRPKKIKKMLKSILLASLVSSSCLASVSEKFLDSVAQIESSGRLNCIGDGGKALGQFQLHRAAWEDAKKNNPSLGDYQTAAFDRDKSRQAARIYFDILTARFRRATGQYPTHGQLYALYNCGFTTFRKAQFQVDRAPLSTRKAVNKINVLMGEE